MLRSVRWSVPVVGLAFLVAGCGGDEITVKTPDGSVTVEQDGAEFTIEGENGEKVEGSTELPDDFPDDVPLIDGTIIQAVTAAGQGYSVVIQVDGDVQAALDEAAALLEGAGYTKEGSQSVSGSMATALYNSAAWQVLLSITPSEDGGPTTVGYTIAKPS